MKRDKENIFLKLPKNSRLISINQYKNFLHLKIKEIKQRRGNK